MAFDEKDKDEQRQVTESVEEITFRRNRDLEGVQLEILVFKLVGIGDTKLRVPGRVPQAKVDAGWPNIKPYLLDIIDHAEF